jgi:hypothetical protein
MEPPQRSSSSTPSASGLGGPLLQMIDSLDAENAELYSSAFARGLVTRRQCLDVPYRVLAAESVLRDAPQEWFAIMMQLVNALREENVFLHKQLLSARPSSRPSFISVPDRYDPSVGGAQEWIDTPESIHELRHLLALRTVRDPEPADAPEDYAGATDAELLELVQSLMDENGELNTKLGATAEPAPIATRLSERSTRSKVSSSVRSMADLAELETLCDEALYREQMEDLLGEIGEVKSKLRKQKARDEHNKIRTPRRVGGKLGDIFPSLGAPDRHGRLEPVSNQSGARLGELMPSLRHSMPVRPAVAPIREPIAYEPLARNVGRVNFHSRTQAVAA